VFDKIAFATAALCLGYVLDAVLGDPQGWPHIARFFGALIAGLEKKLYPYANKKLGGALLLIGVLLIGSGLPFMLTWLAWEISPWLFLFIESVLCWQCLAVTSLIKESKIIYDALKVGDRNAARHALSMIVGRDTERLDGGAITRAAIETVAENTSDGITAPLLFIAVGGAAFGCFYKAASTMDSMIAYKNERYNDFGYTAAKLDDALNFLPSRLCALLMILAARLLGYDAARAFAVWRRDRRKHSSPNSAQTEAVMAGALQIRLAGPNFYGGELINKPYLGDAVRTIEYDDILRTHRLSRMTALLTLAVALLLRGLALGLL
jgi:adenosylcobinamide-phosphate synthase